MAPCAQPERTGSHCGKWRSKSSAAARQMTPGKGSWLARIVPTTSLPPPAPPGSLAPVPPHEQLPASGACRPTPYRGWRPEGGLPRPPPTPLPAATPLRVPPPAAAARLSRAAPHPALPQPATPASPLEPPSTPPRPRRPETAVPQPRTQGLETGQVPAAAPAQLRGAAAAPGCDSPQRGGATAPAARQPPTQDASRRAPQRETAALSPPARGHAPCAAAPPAVVEAPRMPRSPHQPA